MVFHSLSANCYQWQEKQPNVKEESLTDWLLYAISQSKDRFYYNEFTRNEESAVGADWEWWVLTDGSHGLRAYRFLVQAKKLKKGKDNYPLIAYSNRNGLQIDMLIDSAKRRSAMPVYMYYSVSEPEIAAQIRNLYPLSSEIITWCEDCTNGAYLSMAHTVKHRVFDAPRGVISEQSLLNDSIKLSLLDLLLDGQHSAEKILDALNSYFIKNHGEDYFSNAGIKHIGNNIPGYLHALIDANKRKIHLDWFEDEFKHEFEDLGGVAVLDLREDC